MNLEEFLTEIVNDKDADPDIALVMSVLENIASKWHLRILKLELLGADVEFDPHGASLTVTSHLLRIVLVNVICSNIAYALEMEEKETLTVNEQRELSRIISEGYIQIQQDSSKYMNVGGRVIKTGDTDET